MRSIAVSLALAAALLLAVPGTARSASYVAQDVWYSTLYGGAIGGLGGAGFMLLTEDPLDNGDYIVTGVGVGILAGLAYGIYSYSASNRYGLVNLDSAGTTHYAVPKPRPFVSGRGDEATVGVRLDLVRARF
ncbi:hypothetical protein [Thiohalorhabdus sp.]|uniref:hypothetical protein n=1 Tax=Thiohalorhabdus sp. TaxID=3094134 RepID=UPI002FC33AAD